MTPEEFLDLIGWEGSLIDLIDTGFDVEQVRETMPTVYPLLLSIKAQWLPLTELITQAMNETMRLV